MVKEKTERAKLWKSRAGYKQVQLRIRPELLELIDEYVGRLQRIEGTMGRMRTTRTSLILEAIAEVVGYLPGGGEIDE